MVVHSPENWKTIAAKWRQLHGPQEEYRLEAFQRKLQLA